MRMKRKGYKLSDQLHGHAQFQRFLTIPCSRSLTGDHAGDFRSDVRRGNKPLPKIEYDIQKRQNKECWGHRRIGRHEFVARRWYCKGIRGSAACGLDKRRCSAPQIFYASPVIDRVLVNARSVDPCGTTPSIFSAVKAAPGRCPNPRSDSIATTSSSNRVTVSFNRS